ncbi:hypothetical protein DM01DRAFT_1319001 [Hesseltinella vesiculosa]|uniref:Arrestin C-terminal-like domain-containing protein n=1 Tax=Hesseltinella vesiculosa TaxID=101127 RepID=A0A1X2GP58_9FUNG|nr:hypothetical protein DM01DRAFT_1319001 [Hesseltinella vesiculosa]
MVHSFTSKVVDLKIVPDNDTVIFFGQAQESAGTILQGKVLLHTSEPLKIKRLTLVFKGKMRVQWTEGLNHTHKQEQIIIEHDWKILPSLGSKKYHAVGAGQHTWDFNMTLPGHLAPSLNSGMGKVCYGLTATLERMGTLRLGNSTVQRKQPIRVVRSLLPSEFDLVQSLEIKNEWPNKLLYEISLPTKLYAHDATIPISFSIVPIASKLRVHAIMATLKECCSYYDHINNKRKTESRIIKVARQDHPFCEAQPGCSSWTRVLDVHVPAHPPMIFCDAESDMIDISHKLKVTIAVVTADGHFSEMRASIPIVIKDFFGPTISQDLAAQTELPSYDDSWRTLPYNRTLLDRLRHQPAASAQEQPSAEARQPITISSYTRSLALTSATVPHSSPVASDLDDEASIPDTLPEEDDHVWWHGMDLSRVPSYRSVADNTTQEDLCLPPAYDPIWQRCFERTAYPQ